MRPRRSSGFTILELVIALVLCAAVLGAAIALLTSVMRSSTRSEERLQPRERAHMLFLTLRQLLEDATFYRISDRGGRLRFETVARRGEIFVQQPAGCLVLEEPGASAMQLLELGPLRAFRVEPLGRNGLRIAVELERPPAPSALTPLPPLRIADEIFLPGLGAADPAFPWHCILETSPAR